MNTQLPTALQIRQGTMGKGKSTKLYHGILGNTSSSMKKEAEKVATTCKGNCMTLVEIRENDLISGIEVEPANMSEQRSVSTTLEDGHSSSWSTVSSSEDSEECPGIMDKPLIDESPIIIQRPSLQTFPQNGEASPLYGRCIATRRQRLRGADPLKQMANITQPKTETIQISYPENVDYDDTSSKENATTVVALKESKKATIDPNKGQKLEEQAIVARNSFSRTFIPVCKEIEIINLMEPRPETIFSDMFRQSFSVLQEIKLGSLAIESVLKSLRLANKATLSEKYSPLAPFAPFTMDSEELSHFLSLEGNQTYQNAPSQSKSKHQPSITPLLGVSEDRLVRAVNRFAVSGSIPQLILDGSKYGKPGEYQIILKPWRHAAATVKSQGQNGKMKSTRKKDVKIGSMSYSFIEAVSSSESESSNLSSESESSNLFTDKELQAVMSLTKGGQDTSSLFPLCSPVASRDDYSTDGMDDELHALRDIEENLRRELAVVDCVAKVQVSSSEDLEQTKNIGTSEEAQPSRERHVHFSSPHDEYFFFSDEASVQSTDSYGDLQGAWENFYTVCEDLIDELTLTCTKAVDFMPPSPSQNASRTSPQLPSKRQRAQPAKKAPLRRSSIW